MTTLFSLILSLSFAKAATLADVDAFLSADTFQTAFHAGDQTTIETTSCLMGHCEAPYPTLFFVTGADRTQAAIEGRKPDGTVISHQTISATDWQSSRQNRVQMRLQAMSQGGFKVLVKNVGTSSIDLVVNGHKETHATMFVELVGSNSAGMQVTERLEVTPGLGATGQLVRDSLDHGALGTTTYTVADVELKSVGN